jgi:hypothetical protein
MVPDEGVIGGHGEQCFYQGVLSFESVFSGVEVSILPEGRIYGHEAIERNSRPANKVLGLLLQGDL